jgi:hypothetical protein
MVTARLRRALLTQDQYLDSERRREYLYTGPGGGEDGIGFPTLIEGVYYLMFRGRDGALTVREGFEFERHDGDETGCRVRMEFRIIGETIVGVFDPDTVELTLDQPKRFNLSACVPDEPVDPTWNMETIEIDVPEAHIEWSA